MLVRFSFGRTCVLACCTTVLTALLLAGCDRGSPRSMPAGSTAADKPIEVALDPRVELVGIMRTLSREPEALDRLGFSYAARVRAAFAPFARDPALARFAAADRALGGGDVPVWIALHHAPGGALEPIAPLPALLAELNVNPAVPEELMAAVRDFSARTDFPAFFAAAASEHAQLAEPVRHSLGLGRIITPFEAYHGQALPHYRVVLAPLLHDANYGLRVTTSSGTSETSVIVVRRRVADGRAQFGRFGELRPLLWHEFGHAVVNPAVETHRDRLATLAEVLARPQQARAVDDPSLRAASRLSEYVIRAVGIRLTTRELGAKAGQRELQQQVKRGYPLLPGLCVELERYENDRVRYPTLPEFLPEVLAFFEREAASVPGRAVSTD